jgi:hypothetical protein
MKGLYITCGLTIVTVFCLGQERFKVSGHLKYCYNKSIGSNNFERFKVSIIDIEPHYESGQEIEVGESGEFTFENLLPSSYKIATLSLGRSDVTLKVDKNITDVILCVDNNFRPVPEDTLSLFITKAVNDIAENNLKLYHLSPGLILYKKGFDRKNERLKRKFNFQIETIMCFVVVGRQEFIEQERYLAYNKVAEEYLDHKYGTRWRRALK